jgi:hypothetical protein
MLRLLTKPTTDFAYCAKCGQPLERKITALRFDRMTGLPVRQRVSLKCPNHDSVEERLNGHDSFEWTENVAGSH